MGKYVLGEGAARKLRAMFRDGGIRPPMRTRGVGIAPIQNLDPFTVEYSATRAATTDGYIIYLPPGCWHGAEGRVSPLPEETYGRYWYDAQISPTPGTPYRVFVGNSNGTLVTSQGWGPTLVAIVNESASDGSKQVTQVLRSAVTRPAMPFEISTSTGGSGSTTLTLTACHYRVGNLWKYAGQSMNITLTEEQSSLAVKYLCLKVPATQSPSTPTLELVSTSDIESVTHDLYYSYLPLYLLSTYTGTLGAVVCDLRASVTSVQFEV